MIASRLSICALMLTMPSHLLGNVIGSDFQNFNPTTNGLDFVTVQSSETLKPGILNLGLFINFAVNPLPEFEDDKNTGLKRGEMRNSLIGGDLNFGLGILENFDVGLSLPSILLQNVKKENKRVEFADRGLSEIRLHAKYRLLGDDSWGIAGIFSINQNLIEGNPFAGDSPGPTSNFILAADHGLGPFQFGVNLGYRKRSPGKKFPDVPVEPFHDQIIASTAVSYYMEPLDSALILEYFGSFANNDDSDEMKQLQNSGELLLGFKRNQSHNLAIHAGASTYLDQAVSTPDYRIYTGINWTLGPMWGEEEAPVVKKKKKKPEQTFETFILRGILFAFDSSKMVVKSSLKAIKAMGEKFNTPYTRIVVEGHTDSLGTDEYNVDLSGRRAENVRQVFVKMFNIDESKIESVGKGESEPIADNATYQGRQRNRRVEVSIYYD